jgi:hypothetical protein
MNELKSYNHLKYFIVFAKIQGLFLHRSVRKNLVTPIHENNYIFKKTSVNVLHLVYCIFVFLCYNSINILNFLFDMNDLNISSNLSKKNATISFKFEAFNLGLVFKLASVINFSILLAFFFFYTSLKSGFYKISVSYEFL